MKAKLLQRGGSILFIAVLVFNCSLAIAACNPFVPCSGPSAVSLSGCKRGPCGPQPKRQDFCVYDPCPEEVGKAKWLEAKLNDLRCQVEEGHLFAAVRLGHFFLTGEEGVCQDFELAVNWYRKAAEGGIPIAQVQMGHFYRDGSVLPQNPCQAIAWYQRAADQGDMNGMLSLAQMYKGWYGAKPDRAKALALYEKAAACGSADAEYEAGLLLMRTSRKQTAEQGIERLVALAEEGHPDSMAAIGDAYNEGRLGCRDINKAYFYWQKSADAGSALGAFKLGMAYASGECLPKDYVLAAEWNLVAAEKGLPEAELLMGNLFREGRGVPKDYKIAAAWYTKAAGHHMWQAQLELADLYHAGKGAPRFLEEAARRYDIASEMGNNAYASLMLSVLYEDGRGVPQDLCKSVEYYEKARGQCGFLQALYKVGRRYATGYGFKRNVHQAMRWYSLAANAGLAVAQVELGDLHYLGECVPQDFGKAFEWYHKAAVRGHSYAQNMLGLILLEGDCLPQYAKTVVPGFQFGGKRPKNSGDPCNRCQKMICICEPAYSEKASNACTICLMRECARQLQVKCHCDPNACCRCGARNAYHCIAWCQNICNPKHAFCGPVPGRCTVAISKANAERAAQWITKAAMNGAGQAQFQLGVLYLTGIGVRRDEAKSYAWLQTALEGMEDKNPDIINCLIDQMSPEMRKRAVCLAQKTKCRYRKEATAYPRR